jgi:hypothetical protein
MESKIYLEEFLDKLTKMLETSKTEEQIEVCIKYIDNYKLQMTEVIENELFRETTFNFLDELVKQVRNESNTKIYEETEGEEVLR